MKNLKFLLFLTFSLTFCNSCTEELNEPITVSTFDCATQPPDIDYDFVLDGVREQLFVFHDIWNEIGAQDIYQVMETYSSRYFSDVQSEFVTENFGSSEGMLTYFMDESNRVQFSPQLDSILNNADHQFENLVALHPDLETTLQFWRQKANQVSNTEGLCSAEKNVFKMTAAAFSGFLEYAYHFLLLPPTVAGYRSCSDTEWQRLLCQVVGAAGFLGTFYGLLLSAIFVAPTIVAALVILLTIIPASILVSRAANRLCCTWFEEPLPSCNEVEAVLPHSSINDCSEFELKAYGSGADIIRWEWNNFNTVPLTAITDVPQLRVTVPNQSMESTIEVTAICANETETVAYRKILNLSASPPINNTWTTPPPNLAPVAPSVQYDIATLLGNNDHQLALNWSATNGGTVVPNSTHPYKAKVTFWAPGLVIIKVETISLCTGEAHILEKKVVVHE